MKLLNLKKSTEQGSLIIYAFLAVIILGAIAGVSTYVTHNVQTTQRRQSYGEAYNYSEAGLMLAAADVNSAFTNASTSFLETLTGSNLAPYTRNAERSTYNTLVYARTITSPFTNQPVEIELSIPNETEPTKVSITSRAYVRGVAVTNTAVVDLTFAYRAVIVSDHVGSSSATVSEANAMLGNVVIPTATQGSPLAVDGRVIANGRVNLGSVGLGSDFISMTNYGTAKQVPDYTKSDSTDQLFDFKRIIKAADLLGTHYASVDAFIRAAKKEEVFEGIIVVDVRREEEDGVIEIPIVDTDDGKSDKDDAKTDTDDSKSDKDDAKSDKVTKSSSMSLGGDKDDAKKTDTDDSKSDKDDAKTDTDDSKSDKDDAKTDTDDSKSDKDDSKTDKDDDDGKDDKDDPGIDRVDLPKGIYVRGTLVFNYVFDALPTVDDVVDSAKTDKDDAKTDTDDGKSDKDDAKTDTKDNNGHGNNVDGVDSSNPGKSKAEDPSGSVDDEKKSKVTKSSSMILGDDKDDSKSDKDDGKTDKDDSKSDKDDSESDKDDGKSDKDDGDDGKSDPGDGYVAWDDANDVLDGVALYINWIDLDTLDAANPNTYTSAYPPTFSNPEFNPVNLNMLAFGYQNFAAGEDLPALMFNGGSMRLSGLLDICGVVYSPNYIDIQNDGATTQYIKGTVFGGGGVYIENNTSGSRTILSFDSRAVDNLATKYNRGMNVAVKHRD